MAITTVLAVLSSDGNSLTIKDTTPLEEYVGTGIDIDADIVSVTFKLTDDATPTPNEYTLDVTSAFPTYIRDVNGYVITTEDLSYSPVYFADGVWTVTLEIVEDSTGSNNTLESTSQEMFLSQILQVVTSQVIDADWKELYNPYNNRLSSDLRKRLLIISIMYSVQGGLLDRAETTRLALNKICSYDR